MTPTIAGLNQRQLNIANLLWSCNTEDTLVQLIKALPTDQDRRDAASLAVIMIQECQEQELDAYESHALEAIDRARG
jgi:hypothetical protein